MGHLDTIEKAAQRLIALCQKEKQTKTDKEKMLGIHAEILTSIENSLLTNANAAAQSRK